jgi:hypothetical protein
MAWDACDLGEGWGEERREGRERETDRQTEERQREIRPSSFLTHFYPFLNFLPCFEFPALPPVRRRAVKTFGQGTTRAHSPSLPSLLPPASLRMHARTARRKGAVKIDQIVVKRSKMVKEPTPDGVRAIPLRDGPHGPARVHAPKRRATARRSCDRSDGINRCLFTTLLSAQLAEW